MKKIALTTLIMSLLSTGVYAQTPATVEQTNVEEINVSPEVSDPPPTVSDILNAEYETWLTKARSLTIEGCRKLGRDLSSLACNLDANIIVGEAVVSVPMSHPRWVDARQLAYMSAMNNAFKDYASQQGITNQVKLLSRQLQDDTPLQAPSKNMQARSFEEATPSRLSQLFDKAYALGEGFLDQKLREFNVDPEKWERQPIEVKKKLFENSVQQVAEYKARAETAGMIPIQSFYGKDSDGNYGVRVVFSTSPSRIRLVRQMLRQGATIPPDSKMVSSKTIEERFKLSGEQLMDMLGTRLVYDEKGYPVLLAFGQSSVSVPRNNPTFAQRQQVARTAAKNTALNSLTLLLNATTSLQGKNSSSSGVTTEQSMVIDAKDNVTDTLSTEALAREYLDETIDTSGRISNFQGIRPLHTWSYFDRESQKYVVGTVLMWSPETAMQTIEQKNALNGSVSSASQAGNNTNNNPQEATSKQAKETDSYVF